MYNSDVDTASRGGSIEEDVCFPPADAKDEKGGIDFEALEEYIIEERRALAANDAQQNARRRRLSNMGGFGDGKRYGSFYGDRMKVKKISNDNNAFARYCRSSSIIFFLLAFGG